MRGFGCAESLDGSHLLPGNGGNGQYAGAHRLSIHVHGAGAAQPGAAAVLGTLELKAIPDGPKQRSVRRVIGLYRLAVE